MARTTLVRLFPSALALLALGVVVGTVVAGTPAALGVLAGAVTVLAVFSFGMAVTHAVATISPALSLLVALLTYALQLVVLVLALTALERSDALESSLDRDWLGGTIIVGTLLWTVALVRLNVLYHRSANNREPSTDTPSHRAE